MLERLSITVLNDYLPPYGCPRKCYLKNVLRVPIPTPPAFAFGIAFHAAGETCYRARAANKPLSQDDAVTCFIREWQAQAKKVTNWYNTSAIGHESVGRAMMAAYYQSPEYQGLRPDGKLIETKSVFKLNGVPFSLRVDVIDLLGYLYDLKTAKPYSWNQKKADDERQATAYLCWAHEQADLNDQLFTYHVVEKCLEPRVLPFSTERTAARRDDFGREVADTWHKMQLGEWQAVKGAGCRYCDYTSQCQEDLGDFA